MISLVFYQLIFVIAGSFPGAINGMNQTGGNLATKNRKFTLNLSSSCS